MTRKFENFLYDLPQNIIPPLVSLSLKDIALNLCIGRSFKETFANVYSISIERSFRAKNYTSFFYDKWKEIERNVDENLLEYFASMEFNNILCHLVKRKTKIHFIGMQILDLIKKRPHLDIHFPTEFVPFIVFTGQGTINMFKSVLKFTEMSTLGSYQMFKIKCHFFLANEIKESYQLLLDNEKGMARENTEDDILKFWLWEIDGITLNKNHLEENSVFYEKLFFDVIDANNDIAVAYLWNNIISNLKRERAILEEALKSIVDNSLKINILMFLVFQVNENEFEEFFQTSSFKVIENVISEVRWFCLFKYIFDVLNFYFDKNLASKIFGLLCDSNCRYYPKGVGFNLVVNYFVSLDVLFKINIVEVSTPGTRVTKNHFGNISHENKDEYCEKLLLGFQNVTALNAFFLSASGFETLIESAKIGYLYKFLDFFLKNIFGYYELYVIKHNFFHYEKDRICSYFIENSKFSQMKQFVNYFSEYYKSIQQFKDGIPYRNNGRLIRESLFPTDGYLGSENIDKTHILLLWCLHTEEKVELFKSEMDLISDSGYSNVYFDKILDCVKKIPFSLFKPTFGVEKN
ncbi:UNVERIFIED_CONTAM: hypothetical protein RMT77_011335 [Armadillidium vulgare]